MKRPARYVRVYELLGFVLSVLTVGVVVAGVIWNAQWRQRANQRAESARAERELDGAELHMVEVRMRSDGIVLFEGRELAVEDLIPILRRENPNKRLHVTILADNGIPLRDLARVAGVLDEHHVQCEIHTSD